MLQDPRMANIHKLLNFKNAKEWKSRISDLPAGIQDCWRQQELPHTLTNNASGTYWITFRDLIPVIEFLIGHPPFAHEMTYAPIQTFNDDKEGGHQIYHDLHSADWWWESQGKIEPGGTIVPVIISVDKTQLSMHQGDVAAWPVYLTIGNLSATVRRRRLTPGTILVGFVPIVIGAKGQTKRDVYHYSMQRILQRKPIIISNPLVLY